MPPSAAYRSLTDMIAQHHGGTGPQRQSRRAARTHTTIALALSLACALTGMTSAALAQSAAAISQAESLSSAFTSVAERVSPAVVSIKVETRRQARQGSFFFGMPFGGQEEGGTGQGSGFIFRSDGAILTNHHVIDHAERVEVVLQDGRRFDGEVVGADPTTDLAVVKVAAKGLPTVPFADSNQARVGQWVVAIGSPFGLDYSLTVGVVSAIGRGLGGNDKIEDYLQTDASINPGNSGGPLVNLSGQVLGINTMILGPRNAGIGFAIPSNLARRVAEQLLSTGEVQHAWIGVQFQELTPELAKGLGSNADHGALIADVQAGSPAAKAGLEPGDIIVSVDGKPVREGHDLLRFVISKKVGQQVTLDIVRKGKNQSIKLTTAARPGSEARAAGPRGKRGKGGGALSEDFGLRLGSIDSNLARRMQYEGKGKVVVTDVAQGGPAARAGLRPGDVVLEADRRSVKNEKDVEAALSDGTALLRVERNRGSYYVAIKKN